MENAKAIRELIYEIDAHLGRVTVSGDNVFYISDARKLLKALFDMVPDLNEQPPEEERIAWREGGASG